MKKKKEAEPDPEKRSNTFSLFKALYSTRSKIVHGGALRADEDSVRKVQDNLEEVGRLGSSAIAYYLFYHSQNRELPWENHLQDLVIKSAARIVD